MVAAVALAALAGALQAVVASVVTRPHAVDERGLPVTHRDVAQDAVVWLVTLPVAVDWPV